VSVYDNPYQAPELAKVKLNGLIYNDEKKRFADGTSVTTSSLMEIDIKNNIAQTRNTTYKLGEPSEEFLKWLNDNGYKLEDYPLVAINV
jgi:hypothetical protein